MSSAKRQGADKRGARRRGDFGREVAGSESGVVKKIQELEVNLWVPEIEVGVGCSRGSTCSGGRWRTELRWRRSSKVSRGRPGWEVAPVQGEAGKGVRVAGKGPTVAVHWRQSSPELYGKAAGCVLPARV